MHTYMSACLCTKLCLKNAYSWKITLDIFWSYSGSTFAVNRSISYYNYEHKQ